MDDIQMPYFVYGTLRPYGGNDWLWRQAHATCRFDGQVKALNFALVGGRHIPYAVSRQFVWDTLGRPSAPAIGGLIIPSEEEWWAAQLQLRMDQLEGHPNHYVRTQILVDTPDGRQDAWIYLDANPSTWSRDVDLIEDGDYMKYRYGGCP